MYWTVVFSYSIYLESDGVLRLKFKYFHDNSHAMCRKFTPDRLISIVSSKTIKPSKCSFWYQFHSIKCYVQVQQMLATRNTLCKFFYRSSTDPRDRCIFLFCEAENEEKMILLSLWLMEDVKDDFAKTRQGQYKWQF